MEKEDSKTEIIQQPHMIPKPLPEDLDKGEIYMLFCKESCKRYIGQAFCYVSSKTPWGTQGRWKSHIREAYGKNGGNKKDRCSILNSAIRKYGKNGFDILPLIKCNIEDMDYWETEYIESFKTVTPGGYNLSSGGAKGKDSEVTIEKKRLMRLGKKANAETKRNCTVAQFGIRKQKRKRKYEEDNILPKYILADRINGSVTAYSINSYPIGIKIPQYASKSFAISTNGKYKTKADALKAAKEYLAELNKKYAHIPKEIEKMQEDHNKVKFASQLESKKKREESNLPEYIHPLYKKEKKIGVYVEGYKKTDGTDFPKKEFHNAQALCRNVEAAENYIEQMRIYNADNNFEIPELPDYIQKRAEINGTRGFAINNYPIKQKDGSTKKVKKIFINMTDTMEDKYNKTMTCYNNLKKGILPQETKGREKYFRHIHKFE